MSFFREIIFDPVEGNNSLKCKIPTELIDRIKLEDYLEGHDSYTKVKFAGKVTNIVLNKIDPNMNRYFLVGGNILYAFEINEIYTNNTLQFANDINIGDTILGKDAGTKIEFSGVVTGIDLNEHNPNMSRYFVVADYMVFVYLHEIIKIIKPAPLNVK